MIGLSNQRSMDFRQARILSLVSVFFMAVTAFFLVSAENRRPLAADVGIVIEPVKTFSGDEAPAGRSSISLPLSVPEYIQRYKASCEAAAARAALLYYGVSFSEDDILEEIGWSKPPRYYNKSGDLVWGNPQSEFVGDPNPKRIYVDGYGVYNQPIYKFLSNHGFGKSVSKSGWDIEELASYIKSGYPAIVWLSGDFKRRTPGVMIGPDGVKNPWIFAEHAVVLVGFDDNGMELMDPAPGVGYRRVTTKQFEDGFISLGNMAIVVIPGEMAEL
ncbi:MAG: C39 family peptidase [Patescibacteria group bacterium]|nr:C39 family peptidase [Patescibacteria group bacterium]MCL5261844.1 C39 family peptidase [Patescibacteria group bacterium]